MADDSVRTEQLRELTLSDQLESTDEMAELQLVATGEFQQLLEPQEQDGDEDDGSDPYNRT